MAPDGMLQCPADNNDYAITLVAANQDRLPVALEMFDSHETLPRGGTGT